MHNVELIFLLYPSVQNFAPSNPSISSTKIQDVGQINNMYQPNV